MPLTKLNWPVKVKVAATTLAAHLGFVLIYVTVFGGMTWAIWYFKLPLFG